MKKQLGAAILLLFLAAGCAAKENTTYTGEYPWGEAEITVTDTGIILKEGETMTYTQISQDQAKAMMESGEDLQIVDVRRLDEYANGHIPGAICVPNESIGAEQPEALPDLDQTLLVYCRSGRRSKEAAQKLADLGYTRVYEFGGILTWTGDLVLD